MQASHSLALKETDFKEFSMLIRISLVAAALAVTAAGANAMPPGHAVVHGGNAMAGKSATLVAARKTAKQPSGARPGGLAAKRRVLKDTCPGGDQACIDGLIARCDEAGGGLSTQPDGGVDCYVVGIHDQ